MNGTLKVLDLKACLYAINHILGLLYICYVGSHCLSKVNPNAIFSYPNPNIQFA